MTRWGEIKCPRCSAPPMSLWESMGRSLEEGDAREARLEARIEELEAKLELISEEWHGAVYGDLENGVASLNEAAAQDFHRRYPLVSNFGATINRIIDGGEDVG